MKSYTDVEQSKILARIILPESADMYYFRQIDNEYFPPDVESICPIPRFKDGKEDFNYDIPCWSLAALIEQLHYEICDDEGHPAYLSMNKENDKYKLIYHSNFHEDFDDIETEVHDNRVDACYQMIVKLKELNLL